MPKKPSAGFTLIEILIAMVALGAAMSAIISLQGQIMVGHLGNREIVQGNQLLQQCAETVLATRRRLGYTSVTNTLCTNATHTLNGFSTGIVLKLDKDILSSASCASTSTECNVTIELKKGTATLTSMALQLQKY